MANGLADDEARDLARCEAWLSLIRRGPRKVYDEAMDALKSIADGSEHATVRVVATHYRAASRRLSDGMPCTICSLTETQSVSG